MLPILMHGKTCSEVFWVAFGWKFDQTRAGALLSNKKKKSLTSALKYSMCRSR